MATPVFQKEPVAFNCPQASQRIAEDPSFKLRETGVREEFLGGERYFASNQGIESRNSSRSSPSHSGAASDYVDEVDDEDDEEDADEGDGEVEAVAVGEDSNDANCNNGRNTDSNGDKCATDRIGFSNAANHFGSSVDLREKGLNYTKCIKDAGIAVQNSQQGRLGQYSSALSINEPDGDMYKLRFLPGEEDGLASAPNDRVTENNSGSSGRKGYIFPSKSGESLRKILSDPISGDLMDDAMILPCGHSFGSGGIQQVIKMVHYLGLAIRINKLFFV